MNFTSPEFIIFFPVVLVLFYALPERTRWILLLAASWAFYLAWNPWTGILLLLATVCSYTAGIHIEERRASPNAVRFWSAVGIGVPLACLAVFKYAGFFANTTGTLLAHTGIQTSISLPAFVLPIGISFYTFQTLSYVIDVRRGKIPAERHFGFYALFVSFFPQLVAGPIERPGNLLPQLRRVCGSAEQNESAFGRGDGLSGSDDSADGRTVRRPRREDLAEGLRLMLTGFFKKLAVADFLASFVESVYGNPAESTSLAVILATVFFAVQIYCDFSGYSDIACGAARMLGIRLTVNFRLPYLAGSVREFWRRWHISLSGWLIDYIYIPLGGNRRGIGRQIVNVMIVFAISGLWHGANATFVIWGLLHGALVCAETLMTPRDGAVRQLQGTNEPVCAETLMTPRDGAVRRPHGAVLIRRAATFALVCFTWIFFRAESLGDAGILIGRLFSGGTFADTISLMGLTGRGMVHIALALWCLLLLDRPADEPARTKTDNRSRESRALYTVVLVMAIAAAWLMLLANHAGNVFIYFQF